MLLSCSSEPRVEPKAPAAIPVTVGSVTRKSVPLQVRAIGNVEAYSVVSVKSQVGRELAKVHFREGQDVKKGDLLLSIDPRPFEATLRQSEANLAQNLAQVKQAEANLARDLALEQNAEKEAQRYKDLAEKEYISKEQFDQVLTAAEAARATVSADRAAVENVQAGIQASRAVLENSRAAVQVSRAALENSKIQLEYCTIRSPLDGRTGSLLVQQGNLVKASDTQPLVVINQIQPIYVSFSVPEQNLAMIKKYMAAGACAYPISSQVRAEADPTLTLPKVLENPKGYLGSVVIWGGVVSKVSQGAEGSRLLVIQVPLDSHGRPQTQETQGEFIARTSESLDPRVYRKGLTITLAGEIDGVEEKNLGPMEYPRPVLRIIQIHPWEQKHFPLTHGNWEGGFNFPSSSFEEPFADPGY